MYEGESNKNPEEPCQNLTRFSLSFGGKLFLLVHEQLRGDGKGCRVRFSIGVSRENQDMSF